MRIRLMRAVVVWVWALLLSPVAAAERPHVYVVIVDGLDARFVSRDATPTLFGDQARRTLDARSVMPARTNPGHISLLTGTYPAAHGITGNAYWGRGAAPPAKLDDAALIEVRTLFTTARAATPPLVTLGVFGKPKLGHLFAAAPDRQREPEVLWIPPPGGEGVDRITGYAGDATTMAAFLHVTDGREPDLAVINLSDVDRAAHGSGPDSPERRAAVAGADAALAHLLAVLRERGWWERSLVLVTADHGFDDVQPTATRPEPALELAPVLERAGLGGQVQVVSDGGAAHLYGVGVTAAASDVGDAGPALARAAAAVRETPGVVEVLARLPVPGVTLLDVAHPDWHAGHPRGGELLVIAAPGYQLVDPGEIRLRGNHGAPGELTIPLVVLGGHPVARTLDLHAGASLPDVGATIGALLALPPPHYTDGRPVADALCGTPLLPAR